MLCSTFSRQITEQNLAHGQAVDRSPSTDARKDTHGLRSLDPFDVDDIRTVEDAQLDTLVAQRAEPLHVRPGAVTDVPPGQGQRTEFPQLDAEPVALALRVALQPAAAGERGGHAVCRARVHLDDVRQLTSGEPG